MGARSSAVDAIGRRDVAHLYLLTEPDFRFIQDGTRDGQHIRKWMHQRFLEQLSQGTTPTLSLKGSIEHRLREASAAIESLVRVPFDL